MLVVEDIAGNSACHDFILRNSEFDRLLAEKHVVRLLCESGLVVDRVPYLPHPRLVGVTLEVICQNHGVVIPDVDITGIPRSDTVVAFGKLLSEHGPQQKRSNEKRKASLISGMGQVHIFLQICSRRAGA